MNTTALLELASSYWSSAALINAADLGIFDALNTEIKTAESLAKELNLSVQHTEALLNALVGLNILHKKNGNYEIDEKIHPLLNPKHPDCLLDALRFNKNLFHLWSKLDQTIHSGQPVFPENIHLGKDSEKMEEFVRGMHSRAGIMARSVTPHLNLSGCRKMLDLAGGPGTFSIKLLEHYPELHSKVFDLPPIVNAAKKLYPHKSDRICFVSGDYHCDPLPPKNDAVLFCGALHQEIPENSISIFQKIFTSLNKNGRLFIVDMFLEESRTQPVFSALFEINMMLLRNESHVHTITEVTQNLKQSGYSGIQHCWIEGTPYGLISAQKKNS